MWARFVHDLSSAVCITPTDAPHRFCPPTPQDEAFGACLGRFLARSGLSLTSLASRSWLDISYVSRLVHLRVDPLNPLEDERAAHHPSRDTIIRLGVGLNLPIEDLDELLLSAGYAPLVR